MSRTRLSALVLALLMLPVALLTACSMGGTADDKASGTPASAEEPAGVSIPAIGVRSPLMRLGLNKDETVQVPPPEKGMTAGWYTGGAKPGEPGAAVIIGHNDTRDGKAVFHDLGKVGKGTVIDVERGDGKVLHFAVTGTEKVDKKAFPTKKVYGGTSERALRLVTCAGDLDSDGHPVQNLIVYASLRS
ncbi:class F sortase [Streptomyces netropsis]|uniref:Sortase (Surface protein transpeptidase) n=1 Tax=Streptomyces netropsis TaxID=55404 RepID=A0A7W7PBC4_STRNE|nr:class F sortase [Streptomyces netropsis]MBB4884421.1 sortase (surface protein transpeptidase) [Streptomyces netropsis]GGR03801.1 class F sortase [Streptomyces netropsis]